MPPAQLTYVIRHIDPGDKLTGISVGEQDFLPLKTFLQRNAKAYHERHLARTYGAFVGPKIIGYITLVCGEVVLEGAAYRLSEPGVQYNYKSYPAIKIARLLVDSGQRGNKIGEDLVNLSLGIAKGTVCPAVGCRFVVVDSKQQSVDFYKKQGFTFLETDENKARGEPIMFIDLHKAQP